MLHIRINDAAIILLQSSGRSPSISLKLTMFVSQGSRKTLTYLLLIFSAVNTRRSAVQALVVVLTGELGMQVRLSVFDSLALIKMAALHLHFVWSKLCLFCVSGAPYYCGGNHWEFVQMLEKQMIKLESMLVLVIDEICRKNRRNKALLSLLQSDAPQSSIIFVGEQVFITYPSL
ncbi:hypothetical protein DVH24_041523 [Malus domestica]|uniref:Uncharacterized protein n=1 Tax=Malus domestica TaxID=3750 RepID=A0A498IAA8_MALDO|nr:hypothetical protein DVH24_041523 [Malus domestica]